ncbi:methyltransferase domain-containing protein [soil metagenome]
MLENSKTLVEVESCPVCKEINHRPYLTCKDYTVSKASFAIVACKNCSFAFTSPRPAVNDLGWYYESDEYISHSNTSKGLISRLYQMVRKHTLRKKLGLINHEGKKGVLLDIGCGTGEFMSTMKKDNWKTIGIEPSSSARKQGIENYKLDVRDENELENLLPGSFDVITMWHVMEHVPDLNERVQTLRKLLKHDGVIFVAVPNRNSYDAAYYKENWAAYDVPRHLWHFRAQDMRTLMSNGGLEVKKILPMKFDSYYISMLSEKYKTGHSNLIAAVWRGWISNRKAGKEGSSSLIYIIRKK